MEAESTPPRRITRSSKKSEKSLKSVGNGGLRLDSSETSIPEVRRASVVVDDDSDEPKKVSRKRSRPSKKFSESDDYEDCMIDELKDEIKVTKNGTITKSKKEMFKARNEVKPAKKSFMDAYAYE